VYVCAASNAADSKHNTTTRAQLNNNNNNNNVNSLQFKPNPQSITAYGAHADDDTKSTQTLKHTDTNAEKDANASGLYRIPKIAAVPYDDEREARKKKKFVLFVLLL